MEKRHIVVRSAVQTVRMQIVLYRREESETLLCLQGFAVSDGTAENISLPFITFWCGALKGSGSERI